MIWADREWSAGYIDGAWVAGQGEELVVIDPSDESVVASARGASADQFALACKSARRAFDSGAWCALPVQERVAALKRLIAALVSRAETIKDVVVAEAGCPKASAVMAVQVASPLRQAQEIIELFLTLPSIEDNPLPLSERLGVSGPIQSIRRYTPLGVVAAIPAYNFPFFTALWKVIPALITGNTVILRPSPLTPLSALFFAEAAREAALPEGVLNVVIESGTEGARLLTTHAAVDMVAFTGSSGVGSQIMVQAAPTMKRLQLELGGKSAQIFLPDAADRVVAAAAGVCMAHAGQGCAIGTRLFIPNERKSELLQQVAGALGRIRIGAARDPETQMGPVISAAQRARCEHFVQLAAQAGGRIVTGGRRPAHMDRGFYFEPTVLDVPDNSNPAAQEEIFGPVACVIGYRDLDHAVEMANDSRYGLSGYVHGVARPLALNVASRIRSGTVNINGGLASAYASSGGQRLSGIGRERGIEGLRIYQQLSCLNIGG